MWGERGDGGEAEGGLLVTGRLIGSDSSVKQGQRRFFINLFKRHPSKLRKGTKGVIAG